MACTAQQKLRILHSSNSVWRIVAGLLGAAFSELEQMIENMKKILVLVLALCSLMAAQAHKLDRNAQNEEWQAAVMSAVGQFPVKGGYYTGGKPNANFAKTAWRGLNDAYKLPAGAQKVEFDQMQAQPSFCSSATYAALIKALTLWDKSGKISRAAWVNMKPYVGIKDDLNPDGMGQDDGEGFWGRANANGPGIGVLVNEMKAGFSMTAYRGAKSDRNKESVGEKYATDEEWQGCEIWQSMIPGDFVKIFWDRNESKGSDSGAIIGCNADKTADQEQGHSVIFCGFEPNGDVRYWSSNGPGKFPKEMGYGMATCPRTRIQRIVVTRILRPERFDKAKKMKPTVVNKWLWELNGKHHATTAELKKNLGIKD